jgi:hypothetical protein
VAPDNLESKFRELEGSKVDDELAAMKAQLGSKRVVGQVSCTNCSVRGGD